jgi:hypothetical protein
MERIPLLPGLVDEAQKPRVDVLVPNGTPLGAQLKVKGVGWDTTVGPTTAPASSPKLKGVSRTEHVEEGGGKLHFAGSLDLDIDLEEDVEIPAGDDDATGGGSSDAGGTETDPTAARDDGRSLEIKAQAVPKRFVPHRAALQAWFDASSAEDVFARAAGGFVPIRSELYVAATIGPLSAAIGAKLYGDLEIVTTVPLGTTARQVQVNFTGTAELIIPGGPDFPSLAISDLGLLLTLSRTGAGARRLEIEVVPPEQQHVTLPERVGMRIEWSGDPMIAEISTGSLGEIELPDDDALRSLAAKSSFLRRVDVAGLRSRAATALDLGERITFVVAREDAAVLLRGDARRAKAESAIHRIGCLLWDDAFAAAATAKLFPEPVLTEEGHPILPTLDWVLFHRRRDKDCGPAPVVTPPPPPPPPAATACHEVFRLDDPAAIEQVQAFIQEGALDQARRLLTPLGTVTFNEGSSTVADAGTIVSRWGAAAPPQSVWPYRVDGEPGVGDQALVEARARAIAALVGGTDIGVFGGPVDGPLDPCGVWTLLVPSGEAPPATLRHEVYWALNDSDGEFLKELQDNREIVRAVASGRLRRSGHAVFPSGSDGLIEAESSLTEINLDGLAEATDGFVFTGPVDVAGEPLELQANTCAVKIADIVNEGFGAQILEAADQTGWPAGAAAITVVVAVG